MTNAIGGAHCTIQNHKKYKIVKTKKKHRVVELQQYTDYDFEPYLMRWFTVFWVKSFGTEPGVRGTGDDRRPWSPVRSHYCYETYGFEPYYLMVLSNTVILNSDWFSRIRIWFDCRMRNCPCAKISMILKTY